MRRLPEVGDRLATRWAGEAVETLGTVTRTRWVEFEIGRVYYMDVMLDDGRPVLRSNTLPDEWRWAGALECLAELEP